MDKFDFRAAVQGYDNLLLKTFYMHEIAVV